MVWVGSGLFTIQQRTKQRQLSLIEVKHCVQIISWVHGSEGHHGRIFRQDPHGRIIWAIPGITPTLNLSAESNDHSLLVHPAVGIHAAREKGRERPTHETTKRSRTITTPIQIHKQIGLDSPTILHG